MENSIIAITKAARVAWTFIRIATKKVIIIIKQVYYQILQLVNSTLEFLPISINKVMHVALAHNSSDKVIALMDT